MGKWSTFLVSLIPAALAGYLCFLLVTYGLPVAEDMSPMFWGPLGAGFLACVMCLLAPFGIAIFVKSGPKATKPEHSSAMDEDDDDEFASDSQMLSGEEDEFASDEFASGEMDDDFDDDSFSDSELPAADDDDDFEFDSSSDFESAELDADEFSDEFDVFEDDEDDKKS